MKENTEGRLKKCSLIGLVVILALVVLGPLVGAALAQEQEQKPEVEEVDYDLPHGNYSQSDYRVGGDPHDLEATDSKDGYSVSVDLSAGAALDFHWFGSRASDNAYGNITITIDNLDDGDRHGWEVAYLGNEHIGEHEEGSLVDYHDIVAGYVWRFAEGKYELWTGVENFYGPEQYGSEWLLFIAPLGKFTYTPSNRWDLTSIVQYVGTHHVEYSGDRIFLVEELTFHPVQRRRFELDFTLAGVYGDTSRRSLYGGPTLTFLFGKIDVWAKAFAIYTVEADGSRTRLAPRPVIGISF